MPRYTLLFEYSVEQVQEVEEEIIPGILDQVLKVE